MLYFIFILQKKCFNNEKHNLIQCSLKQIAKIFLSILIKMSANELSGHRRPWPLISDLWHTNRKKPALALRHTHIFSSVSPLVSPSLLLLQVSLLSVSTCLPIVHNWISLNDEDLSLCYHRAEPRKVLEHCSMQTHTQTHKHNEGRGCEAF